MLAGLFYTSSAVPTPRSRSTQYRSDPPHEFDGDGVPLVVGTEQKRESDLEQVVIKTWSGNKGLKCAGLADTEAGRTFTSGSSTTTATTIGHVSARES